MSTMPAFAQPFIVALMSVFSSPHRASQEVDTTPVLTISGRATSMAAPTEFYAFTPTVHQSGDRALRFKVLNKPSWAKFGKKRGTLFGVPQSGDAGSYANIVITVSDGRTTVELPAFSIHVAAPVVAARK